MKARVIDIDKGYNNLFKLNRINPSGVDIGVFSNAMNKGKSVAEYAIANEFGVPSKNVPSRPFLRSTFDQNVDKIEDMIKAFVKAFIKRSISERNFFRTVGSMLQDKIKLRITESKSWAIANKASTIARKKGGDTPLIDTGRLRQSIIYKTTTGSTK